MTLYRNRNNRNVVVRVVSMNAEFRLGEMRSECVVYERNGRHYVRNRAEFVAKFEPINDSALTERKV